MRAPDFDRYLPDPGIESTLCQTCLSAEIEHPDDDDCVECSDCRIEREDEEDEPDDDDGVSP